MATIDANKNLSANTRTNTARRYTALALMLASGFAGLGYQIVWTQQASLWLGHETAAVLAVVAAFFGGLTLGAFLFGARIERSARAVHWYALCEFVIALWSLLLIVLMTPLSARLLDLIGVQPTPLWQWSVAFFGVLILLLPATMAMGATLPAMQRITVQMSERANSIAALYASNTFGAVLGVIASVFWLVPAIGLRGTAAICVAFNLFCALAALIVFARNRSTVPEISIEEFSNREKLAIQKIAHDNGVLLKLLVTGFLGIGYEVLVVRVLSQVSEDTVFTFALLLAIYLIGTAIGAALYQRYFLSRDSENKSLGDRLLCWLAIACLIGSASLWLCEYEKHFLLPLFGASMTAVITVEAMLALFAFGLPTLIMGALFSHLSARAIDAGIGFGRALSVNTFGAALAPIIFGVIALPLLGPKFALLSISLGYLALAGFRFWKQPLTAVTASAIFLIAVFAPRLEFITVPEGGRVISYSDGVAAAVSVVADAEDVLRLRINNRQQEGSSATMRVDARQALLPLLLYPAPKRALFLGLGTGITASAAAEIPDVQVDAVELLPDVIAASSYFMKAVGVTDNSQLHFIAADARRYVRASDQHYDVIVADNFHPARSGSGALYTVEHFNAVHARLTRAGIFCQWLPLHQLDLDTLRSIVQSFLIAYPHATAIIASNSLETPVIGLIGRADDKRFDVSALQQHFAAMPQTLLLNLGIEDEFALFGSFIAGPQALQQFAGSAPANTDNFPIVTYRAPRITYAPDSLPRDRLSEFLSVVSITSSDIVARDDAALLAANWSQRLAAYWQARNRFIETGRAVRPVGDARGMLAQVRDPLLAILHISPDFRPAYDPLVRMAVGLAVTDTHNARALLNELIQTQPTRPEAQLALQQIDSIN